MTEGMQAMIDTIPDETRDQVMLEVSESRERARMIDPDELRAPLKRRLFELGTPKFFPDYPAGKRDAYRSVLRWLDELEGRES